MINAQTGMAYGLFLKQWFQQNPDDKREIYTTFVAAPNPDAHAAAGDLIIGTYYSIRNK